MTPYTRNRERTIEIVCETLNNPLLRKDGISIMFVDEDWTYVAGFKCVTLFDTLYAMAGIYDEGMVEIADVDHYCNDDDYKEAIHDFVKTYFDSNDFMKNVKSFQIAFDRLL